MAYVVGIVLSLSVVLFARRVGFDRDHFRSEIPKTLTVDVVVTCDNGSAALDAAFEYSATVPVFVLPSPNESGERLC